MASRDAVTRERLDGIESLRGFAALSIILFHLVWVAHVQLPTTIDITKYYLGMGVPLFFVISAFSLSYGYLGRLDRGEGLVNYYVRRFARIAPLLYFMLVVQVTLAWFVWNIGYSLSNITLNVTFLFNLVPTLVDGIVPASWSIGVEMIFYLILPGVLILTRGYSGSLLLIALSLVLAGEFSAAVLNAKDINPQFAHHGFAVCLPYFCFGFLALHMYRSFAQRSRVEQDVFAYLLYLLTPVTIWVLVFHSSLFTPFGVGPVNRIHSSMWGLPFAFLVVAISLRPVWILVNPLTQFWGRVSFSLYLTHPNIIFFLYKGGLYEAISSACGNIPSFAFPACAAVTIALVSIASWVTFTYIEMPGIALGHRIIQQGLRKAVMGTRPRAGVAMAAQPQA